jgi:hypothetical protein
VYMGTNTFCRHGFRSDRKTKKNPRENWVFREGAFEPIVSPEQFLRAQHIIEAGRKRPTNGEMLEILRKLLRRKGTLNSQIIDNAPGVPSTHTYYDHFGGISQAYRLIGFCPKKDCSYTTAGHSFSPLKQELAEDLAARIRSRGGTAKTQSVPPGSLLINDGITARIMCSRPRTWPQGDTVWPLMLRQQRTVDILVVARIDASYSSVFDYYVIPRLAKLRGGFHIRARNNAAFLDLYQMDNLDPLVETLARPLIPVFI